MALEKKTTEFIESLDHDDLVCFLAVYSKATRPNDVKIYEAVKEEIQNKVSKDKTEQELWDTETENNK